MMTHRLKFLLLNRFLQSTSICDFWQLLHRLIFKLPQKKRLILEGFRCSANRRKKIVTQIFFAHSSYFLFFLLALVFTSLWLLAHMWNRRTKRPSGRDTCSLSLPSAWCLYRGTFEGRRRSRFGSQKCVPQASTANFRSLQPICLFFDVEKVQMHRVTIFGAYECYTLTYFCGVCIILGTVIAFQ